METALYILLIIAAIPVAALVRLLAYKAPYTDRASIFDLWERFSLWRYRRKERKKVDALRRKLTEQIEQRQSLNDKQDK